MVRGLANVTWRCSTAVDGAGRGSISMVRGLANVTWRCSTAVDGAGETAVRWLVVDGVGGNAGASKGLM